MSDRFVSSRRQFLQSAAAASSLALSPFAKAAVRNESPQEAPGADFSALKPLGSRVKPSTPDEFRARLTRAQQLMTANRGQHLRFQRFRQPVFHVVLC